MELLRARRVITMDPARPFAEAVAIANGRIEFVGNAAEADAHYGARVDVRRVDLGDAVVIPGFNDNHLHAMSMGQFFASPRIAGMDRKAILGFLAEIWKDEPGGRLLVARGWDYPFCPDPDRRSLDRAFPNNPVVLIQFSGHGAWLNSRALDHFGITESTREPEGGRILKDENGRLTGILTDDAVRPIHQRRFRESLKTFDNAERHLEEALRRFAAAGITSVQDNTWLPRAAGYYHRFRRQRRLTVRVSCWAYGELASAEFLFRLRRFDSHWVRRGPVKLFLDGTFSTRTAWMVDPYPGASDDRSQAYGTATHTPEWLTESLQRHAGRGQQVAAHAIGDGAVRAFANAVAAASAEVPRIREQRTRIEHGQLVHPDDLGRLAELGMLVAAQPNAAVSPEKDLSILGEERFRRAYPYRALLDAGVPLSFGSDVPGEETYEPLFGVQLAVDRDSDQTIGVAEALEAYTAGSAYAEFAEGAKGRIKVGMYADLAVLGADPLETESSQLSRIAVEKTIVDGREVYDRVDGYFPEGRAIAARRSEDASIPTSSGTVNPVSQ